MSKNMEEYINDHLIVYENKKATKAETEAALKRLDARENKIAEEKKLPKKLSKQEEYDTYFNKRSPMYYKNRKKGDFLTLQEKAKKIKALQAKVKKIPIIPPKPDLMNGHSDWTSDDWLNVVDPGGWANEKKRAGGILEQELANEHWQTEYEKYLNGGGTLSYQQFMQLQLTKTVNQKINKIAEEKKQTEGLAAILGVSSGRTT
jgi:hypothetical protein